MEQHSKVKSCNVVVSGHWNAALFTPIGLMQRLFRANETEAVNVEVALDQWAPHRVRYGNLIASVASHAMVVELKDYTIQDLHRAMQLVASCIDGLNQTPFFAAGYNIAYHASELNDECFRWLKCPGLDDKLADHDLLVENRGLGRTLLFNEGTIEIDVKTNSERSDMPGGPTSIGLSVGFRRASKNYADLVKWLKVPLATLEKTERDIRDVFLKST